MNATALIALTVFAVFPSMAQATGQTSVPPTPQVSAKRPAKHGPVRPAIVVPASARAKPALRASTAQGAAARVNKPLLPTLPDFKLVTRDGLTVSSKSLAQTSNWILIYRRDHCLSCDRLMNALAAGSSVEAGKGQSFAIIVVGKNKAALDTVRANFANLVNATWVSDPAEESTRALKVHAAPVLYGMSGNTISWKLTGNLPSSALVEQRASAWLAAPPASKPVAASSAPATTSVPAPK
jgi:hypothetical protein